ncbi:MAG: glycosyltransferase family 4 protein [Bdellovibrionales bacterium]|nr:glycosyltransferase family 4 protein [Bdellovibrionales bacterium]
MKITIVTGPCLPTPALEGGSTNRIWQGLAEEFAKVGHTVTILARAHPEQPAQEIINGVSYLRRGGYDQTSSLLLNLFKDLVYGIRLLNHLPQSDIFVINDFWLPLLSTLKKSNVGKLVVVLGRFPKGQLPLYRFVDEIIVLTKALKDEAIRQYPACRDKLSLIPNPIDLKALSPRETAKPPSMSKKILYVGRVHPEKGIDLLIEAFSLVYQQRQDIELRIVGPEQTAQGGGGATYFSHLKEVASGLPVTFVGPIFDFSELAKLYREADIFCYPSLAEQGETFGVAPLEAMACGLLPIVSRLKCFEDTIIHGKTGFTFSHKAEQPPIELAQVMQLALEPSGRNAQIRQHALEHAQLYDYEQIASRYLRSFEDLLQGTQM